MRGDFEGFLRSVRSAVGPLEWSEWIAVAGTAAAHPQDWVAAVQSLSVEQQYDLLELLRRDDAGPFADHLLMITARSANEFEDPQVREFLLGDAMEAAERTLAFMTRHRAEVERLVGQAVQRSEGAMDVAAEIVRLEARLNELRMAEIDTEYERVNDLEREIGRLEVFRRGLESYDREGRTQYREQLEQDTAASRAERNALEESIAAAIAERDRVARSATGSTDTLVELQAQVEQLRLRQGEEAARATTVSDELAAAEDQLRRLTEQRHRQAADLARAEQAISAAREAIAQDAARLKELQESVAAQSHEEIARRVQELWRMLPADLADPEFTTRRA